jgi:hypothetical protein
MERCMNDIKNLRLEVAARENNHPKSKNARPGRGGARKGAGRKPGSATKRTRAIADKAAAEGKTPLEVMLETMCAFMDQAKKVAKSDPETGLKLMAAASNVAKDAAPYIHPRLQAIEHTCANGGPLQYESVLLELAERLGE